MADLTQIKSLAGEFMRASGFYGGGQAGTIGKTILDNLDSDEQSEYMWDLPRQDLQWAEFFSKAAIRQGLLEEVKALVPNGPVVDDKTLIALNQHSPSFAFVLSLGQRAR